MKNVLDDVCHQPFDKTYSDVCCEASSIVATVPLQCEMLWVEGWLVTLLQQRGYFCWKLSKCSNSWNKGLRVGRGGCGPRDVKSSSTFWSPNVQQVIEVHRVSLELAQKLLTGLTAQYTKVVIVWGGAVFITCGISRVVSTGHLVHLNYIIYTWPL